MTRLHLRLAGLVAALSMSACATEYPRSSIDPRTDFAEAIHGLYTSVFWWSVVILAVVWLLLGYILFRFRARPGAPLPRQSHGNLVLEVGWTLGPAVIVIAILVPTIQALFRTQPADPEGGYVIDVIGHQFWWEFRYPEGAVTANELHLPIGRPVSLRLQSADVIHSFWVPQLGGKRDLNPVVRRPEGVSAHYNWLHFTVNEAGQYDGQCAEFCGLGHALMGTRVVAQSEQEFQGWLAAWAQGAPFPAPPDSAAAAPPADSAAAAAPAAPPPSPAQPAAPDSAAAAAQPAPAPAQDLVAQGRQVFHGNVCIVCHAIQGTPAAGPLGPNLTLFGQRSTLAAGWLENNEENLIRWITAPGQVKPGAMMPGIAEPGGNFPPTGLTEDQVRAVAAYLLSLR